MASGGVAGAPSDAQFKFGTTIVAGIQGAHIFPSLGAAPPRRGGGGGAGRRVENALPTRPRPISSLPDTHVVTQGGACTRTAAAASNPNLAVTYRRGFSVQGVYTQAELDASVAAAAAADVVVVALGEGTYAERPGDIDGMRLRGDHGRAHATAVW